MLQTPTTFNPDMNNAGVPFTSQMGGMPGQMNGYSNPNMGPNMGQGMMQGMGAQGGGQNTPPQSLGSYMPSQMDQIMGDPQTQSYAHGGRTRKKRTTMVEAHMSPDEIASMVEAQGGPEYDRKTGRHVFKRLSRFIENPHVERAIKAKFAHGGRVSFAEGGSTGGYSMPERSPMSAEDYGRGGDTDMVYITPYMDKLFKSIGAHSENPITGKSEYFGLSDVWNGVKDYGKQGIGLLNDYAPEISAAGMPLANQLPGWQGKLATTALALAPQGIKALNNYVNPGRAAVAPDANRMLGAQALGQFGANAYQYFNQPGQNPGQFAGNVMNNVKNQVGNFAANQLVNSNLGQRLGGAPGPGGQRHQITPGYPQQTSMPQHYGQPGSDQFLQQLLGGLKPQTPQMPGAAPQGMMPQGQPLGQQGGAPGGGQAGGSQDPLLQQAFGADPYGSEDLYGGGTKRPTPDNYETFRKREQVQRTPGNSLYNKTQAQLAKYKNSNNWSAQTDQFDSNVPPIDPRYLQLMRNSPYGQSM